MGVATKYKVVTTNCCLGGLKCQRCFSNDARCLATFRKKQKRLEVWVECYETDFGRCHSCNKRIVSKFKRLDTL